MWLKQSTVQVINFGPMLDKGNGVDLEIGLVSVLDHATTGIMLSKNGGTLAVREQGGNFVASIYDTNGCYRVSLSAIDTGTLGRLRVIYVDPTTCLPHWQDFMVVPAQVWDSLFGIDKLDVAVVEQANIDFGALQKASLNAATPASVQNIPATGSGFTALGDARLANLDAAISTRSTAAQGATAGELAASQADIIAALPVAPDNAGIAAIEATLTAIKGAGWTAETLKAIKAAIDGFNPVQVFSGFSVTASQEQATATIDGSATAKAIFKAGESKDLVLYVKDRNKQAIDLSAASLSLGVKASKTDAVEVISKVNADFDVSQAASGIVSVHLDENDTDQTPRSYVAELRMSWGVGEDTIVKSSDIVLEIQRAVTI